MSTLEIAHCSLQTSDTVEQTKHDVSAVLARQPLVAGFTELGKAAHLQAAADSARFYGYNLRAAGEVVLMWRLPALELDYGSLRVHDGVPGAYEPRFLLWSTLDWYGETVTVGVAHWVRPGTARRRAHRRAMTDATIALMARSSTGPKIAFMVGDTNEDASWGGPVANAYRDAGIRTIYDELRHYPATGPGGGTIDWIASCNRDTRVKGTGFRVYRNLNTDHDAVTAYYAIEPRP